MGTLTSPNNKRIQFGGSTSINFKLNLDFVFKIDTRITGATTTDDKSIKIPTSTYVGMNIIKDYDCTVYWGDGTSDNYNNPKPTIQHTYDIGGIYTITIKGIFPYVNFYDTNSGEGDKLLEILNFGSVGWESMNLSFYDSHNLTRVKGYADFSGVTTLNRMFQGCSSLSNISLKHWDISNVTDISFLFLNCILLGDDIIKNIKYWNTGNIEKAWSVFAYTKITYLDLNNWDTSKLKSIYNMFGLCNDLVTIKLDQWDTSALEEIDWAFKNSPSLKYVDISNWNISNLIDAGQLFRDSNNWEDSQYDDLLISWSQQSSIPSGISIDFGDAIAQTQAAIDAKNLLINTYSWTIYDGI